MASQQQLHQRPHEGKLGIVTGGSRGIGAAVARGLAAKGCNLLLVYTSESSTAPTEALCEELASVHGVRVSPLRADLQDAEAAAPRIVEAARAFFASYNPSSPAEDFTIDILVNNAGVSSNQFLNDPAKGPIQASEFDRVYRVNVLAPLLLMQTAAPHLPRPTAGLHKGRVVNVSSVSSSIGYPGQSVYAGTKAALDAMTRSWARELADRATVNAVNPGPAWGDMYAASGSKFWRINQPYVDAAPLSAYDGEEEVLRMAAAGAAPGAEEEERRRFDDIVRNGMGGRRPGFTSEIAGTIIMLCSDEAGWTTGSVVCANGGMKMSIA